MKPYNNPPKLNTSRRFPDNMASAHSLMLKGKHGEKGDTSGAPYALPAFNITTLYQLDAAMDAFEILGSSGLIEFSASALKHVGGGDPLTGLEQFSDYAAQRAADSNIMLATHLDHGDYISENGRKIVQGAVEMLTSVMADNSTDHVAKQPTDLADNIGYTREVVEMAHPMGVSVEGELGVLAGVEDEDTKSDFSTYTRPDEFEQFITEAGVLMVAPTIGTMHGPNKGKPGTKVKLNIELAHELLALANKIAPDTCFVAHGASTLFPQTQNYALEQMAKLGFADDAAPVQKWRDFVGTDWDQIQGLIGAGFAKINTDTEIRQSYLAALLGAVAENPVKVDIRWYEKKTYEAMVQSFMIKLIMAGDYGVWDEPQVDVNKFKFDLNVSLADALKNAQ